MSDSTPAQPPNNRLEEKPASYSGGRHPYPITYKATGTFPDAATADAAIANYMERYHPAGYGTQVDARDLKPDGTVYVVLWRLHSCE